MLRVGLSGGIGSGKSTVARRLVDHGAVLIDADQVAREVVARDTPGLAELVVAFGRDILNDDGTLDRSAIARRVFADEEALAALNAIMHPRIAARTGELLAEVSDESIVVHDVPLLVENNLAANYHLVVIVFADLDRRIARLVNDRGMTEAQARARVAAQATDEQRHAVADVALYNNGTVEELRAAVDRLWHTRLLPTLLEGV